MNDKYDVIVIGAGNAGLIAALELAKKEKKVLVIESNPVPGGLATSFIRGRFEFDVSLHQLLEYGKKENPGKIYKLFEKLGIAEKIDFVPSKEAYHVYSIEDKIDYKMPFGIDKYIEKMEEYVPESREALQNFFNLAIEIKDALIYIEENAGHVKEEILKTEYENFMKVSTHSVEKVLDALKMPKKAQEILTSCWIYLGSASNTLSFVHFASWLYSYISFGAQVPHKRSHEISVILAEEIEKNGGVIKYASSVKEILFKEKRIAGVELTNNEIYRSNHIISSVSPTMVYGSMIPHPVVPKEAIKLTNSRVLGARGFSIYIGLNQTAEDLQLTDYQYVIYNSLNSTKEFQNMNSLKNTSSIVTVLNNVVPSCSPKGTTILNFTTLFFGDTFSKNVNEKNYFKIKEEIASNLIETFEKTTGIKIKPYIEEIEIATPVTFARFTKHPDGVIFGYKATGLDNLLPRLLSKEGENYIKNLRFCGGFGTYLSGYGATYLSGELAAKQTLRDIQNELREEEF